MSTARVLMAFVLVALLAPAGARAAGQCSNSQYGLVCQPTVASISASQTSFAIAWTPGGGVLPPTVALVEGGTPAKSFQDGKKLATATATAVGYASYQLNASNLTASTSYQNLRVVGYWANAYAASDPFVVTTSSGGSTGATFPVPAFTNASFSQGKIVVSWTSGKNYDAYNVRSETGAVLDANANQTEIDGGLNGSYTAYQSKPGPYSFIVQGCIKNFLGLASSTCSHWSQQVMVTIPTGPTPTVATYSWPHLTAGDCVLQNGFLVLRSDGSAMWTAQVKTTKTHSGDIWHAELRGRNAAGLIAADFGTLDGPTMSDNHGFYVWSRPFQYDASVYSQITSMTLEKSC